MPVLAPAPKPSKNRDAERLLNRLAAVRRRYWFYNAFRGLCLLLTVLVGGVVAAVVLDWRLPTPSLVRAAALVAILAGSGLVVYRNLLRPLRRRMDNLTLALRIEERYPSLNDSLASTVQFLGDPDPHGQSPGMRQEAIRRTLNKAQGLDFKRVIDTRGLRPSLAGMALALAGAGLLAWLVPVTARTALVRLADPFGDHRWTQLELDPPRDRIGRNEAYEVSGTVRGVIPDSAVVTYKVDDAGAVETVARIVEGDEPGSRRFSVSFRPGQMNRNFAFRVQVNDASTEWQRVTVLPPPILVPLGGRASPQVRLEYPAYTERSPQWLKPDGTGSIDTIAGTVAHLRAAADRPLRAARVEYRPTLPALSATAGLLPLTGQGPIDQASLAALSASLAGPQEAVLDGDPRSFTVRFAPGLNGFYRLYIEDETGLHNEYVYPLKISPDKPPEVTLERPNSRRESLEVLPTAVLPLEAIADDTPHSVRSVWLEYRCDPETTFRGVPLYDHERTAARLVLAPLTWPGGMALETIRPQRYVVARDLSLARLHRADGSALRPGDVVTVRVCASDFDDVEWNKQPGQSSEVEIHIVSQPALELSLHQEQARVQQELHDLRTLEREAIRKVTEIENRVAQTGELTPEDLVELARAEQMQQQLRERVNNREQESVQTRLDRIRRTLEQNGLTRSAAHDRMDQVSRDLERLARQEFEQIEARLNLARKMGETPEDAQARQQAERLEEQARKLEELARELETNPPADPKEAAAQKQEAAELQRQARAVRDQAQALRQGEGADRRKAELERLAQEQEKQAQALAGRADLRPPREKALLRQAEALREAARAVREAGEPGPASDPRALKQQLTDARRGQEEVEKTLSELLQRLEPWSSSREIKAESRALLEEQERLMQEVEDMKKRGFLGKEREELTPEEKARLDSAAATQQKLRQRTQELLDKMRRVAAERRDRDPTTAQELEEAHRKGTDANITGIMKAARDNLERNRLTQATRDQEDTRQELQQLVKQLEDRRSAELDRAIKKQRETEKELTELLKEQERLQKKIKEAAEIKDPAAREAALKKLAGEQQQLQEQAREMARKLSRLGNERASEALNQASKQMEEAVKTLSRGQADNEKQEEALDRIDEGLEDVEQDRTQNEDELTREQLARVADVLKRLKERQERQSGEADRIYQEVKTAGAWGRGLQRSLLELGESQQTLGRETQSLAERELNGMLVIQRLLRRAGDAMGRAGTGFAEQLKRVKEMPEDVAPDEPARQAQAEALRRLTQLLDAVKQEAEASGPRPAGQRGSGGQATSRGGDEGLPPLAQLKLLRTMQAEVNKKTQEFLKKNPDAEKLTAEQKAELETIRREQREVAELVEELIRPGTGEGAGR